MWHSIRKIVSVCVFVSRCVGEDWQFQQMCSMRWQHGIYFACSIWHVWMLPCILSWCEMIARDIQPCWNHSLLSLRHQYQNFFLPNTEKRHDWCTDMSLSLVSFHNFLFSFRILWLTEGSEQTNAKHTSISLWVRIWTWHWGAHYLTETLSLM